MKDSQGQSMQYFEELVKKHALQAGTIEKPSFQGKHTNIIYELLQNADEAQASSVIFEIYNNKLIFKHNGKRNFSISNPETEDEDTKSEKLGDINAITSITNFTQNKIKISRFGPGFKTIFQYTISPMVYDDNFRFQINQYIIPCLVNKDYSGRKPNETIFVFPFNNPDKSTTDCYTDISEKLKSLSFSTLFLKTINQVTILFPDKTVIKIDKKIQTALDFNEIKAEFLILTNQMGDEKIINQFWIFSQQIDSNDRISIGFTVNESGQLIPSRNLIFSLFPINQMSQLKFIINGPFLLSDTYEAIIESDSHNVTILNKLANLSAKSILIFKEIGEKNQTRIIDENILQIIPTTLLLSSTFPFKYLSNAPFYKSIQKVFQTEEIIPTNEGFVSKQNAYWASDPQLIEVFSHEQFTLLVNNENAKWVFTKLSQTNEKGEKNPFSPFISSIVNLTIDDDLLFAKPQNINNYQSSSSTSTSNWLRSNTTGWGKSATSWSNSNISTNSHINKLINCDFVEKQSFDWLHKFYKCISEKEERIKKAKYSPILINDKGKAISAFNSNSNTLQLFFPFDSSKETINAKLIENKETFIFLKKIGLSVPNLKNEILTTIIPKYKNEEYFDTFQDFKKLFFFYKYCSYDEEKEFIKSIAKVSFIMYFTKENRKIDRDEAINLYFPYNYLLEFFENDPKRKFIAIDQYKELINKEDEPLLFSFFEKLGVKKNVEIIKVQLSSDTVTKFKLPSPYSTRGKWWSEYRFEGFDEIWNLVRKNPTKAIVLWNVLLNIAKYNDMKIFDYGCCNYFYYCDHREIFPSVFKNLLVNEKWLLTEKNELVSPSEVFLKELPKQFHADDNDVLPLCQFLNIKTRNVELLTQEYANDHDFIQRLINSGLLNKVKNELAEKESKTKQTTK